MSKVRGMKDLFARRHFDRDVIVVCMLWYLNNLIEKDHRGIKSRTGPMLGFKTFDCAATKVAGIELLHLIRKGQFDLGRFHLKNQTVPAMWNAALAA